MLSAILALVSAALFTGAAFYINFAEQPARLGLNESALLQEWKPSYQRGFMMQSVLAILAFVFGLIAWYQFNQLSLLAGALFAIANWPFTLFVIMPVNHQLDATAIENANADTRQLIEKWGKLHAVRTALGAAATLSFVWAML